MLQRKSLESDEEPQTFTEKWRKITLINYLAARALVHLSDATMEEDLEELTNTDSDPPSSSAKWSKVAPSLSLQPNMHLYQLDQLVVPTAVLPPSFHRKLMKNAFLWMDVYQEIWVGVRVESRMRLLDAWFVPICALFAGRLMDKSQVPLRAPSKVSGGQVKHKVFVLHNVILLVVEMTNPSTDLCDYYAQALLELKSAMEQDRDGDLDPQPHIYAMLSDLRDFYFSSYDGTRFQVVSRFSVRLGSRSQFLAGMVHVANTVFSLLLNGFIGVLEVVEKRSRVDGDASTHRNPTINMVHKKNSRTSLEEALNKAREAQNVLTNLNFTNESAWEEAGQRGLAALTQSVKTLYKLGSHEKWDDGDSTREIGAVMDQVIEGHRSGVAEAGCFPL